MRTMIARDPMTDSKHRGKPTPLKVIQTQQPATPGDDAYQGQMNSDPPTGSDPSEPGVESSATSEAGGTLGKAEEGRPANGDSSSTEPTSPDQDEQQSEEFPDYSSASIPKYSKTQLKKFGKDQLIAIILQLVNFLTAVLKNYQNIVERVRRDRDVKFAKGSDSSVVNFEKPQADQTKDYVDAENDENDTEDKQDSEKPEKPASAPEQEQKRKWTPKRGKGHTEHRDDDILVCTYEKTPDPEWFRQVFGDHEYELISTTYLDEYHVVPARVFLLRKHVYTYKDKETNQIYQSETAANSKYLPRSRLTAELLGYLATEYYFNACPVNRITDRLNQEGCQITKQSVYEWLRKYGKQVIMPVAVRLHQLCLQQGRIQMDETYITSLEEMENTGRKKCYFWQMRTSEHLKNVPQIIVYAFTKSRSAEELKKLLEGFAGKLCCDGYQVYPSVARLSTLIEICCCFWHVYHAFVDVLRGIQGWKGMSQEEHEKVPAYLIVQKMHAVFEEERKLKDLPSYDERLDRRTNTIAPIVRDIYDEIRKYHDAPDFDQGSLFGKALTYALNREDYIFTGIKDPDMPIHNLGCERNFVGTSLFRNNVKFFSTNEGATQAGHYFTVGSTCKANGYDIGIYFKFLFEVIPGVMKAHEDDVNRGDLSFLDAYMPWSKAHQEYEVRNKASAWDLIKETIGQSSAKGA